jgi:molecular chaperone GrpE
MGAEAGASSVEPVTEPLSEALERAPEGDAATAFLRRAQLAEDRLAEVLSAYRTLKRENDGHRERVARNLERRFEGRRERLLLRFIEVLDNLDRALEAAETSFASSALVEGLILVRTQLLHLLSDEGLERIPVLGLPYEPQFSEAVETVAVGDPERHHIVVKELLRGYRLSGRVARASRVVVAEYVQGAVAPAGEDGAPAHLSSLGVDLRAANHRWHAPTPEPFTPPEGVAVPAAMTGRSQDELTLDEIIARAEAVEHDRRHGPSDGDAHVLDADKVRDDDGEDLLGYIVDDEPTEDDRG